MSAENKTNRMVLQRLTVAAGLAAEEALLEAVCQGESAMGWLAWSPRDQALVMPRRHQRLEGFDAACEQLAGQGWPVLLRNTGGTPVPQGPMVVNVALAMRCQSGGRAELEWGYRRFGEPWCAWLETLGVSAANLGAAPGAYCDGRFNVRIGQRKLVGTAQRWRRVKRTGQGREEKADGGDDMAVLVHGAMQVEGEPAELVEVVNTFQRAVGDSELFDPDSHIALSQAAPGLGSGVAVDASIAELLARVAASSVELKLPDAGDSFG